MMTSFVNNLSVALCAALASTACARADGTPRVAQRDAAAVAHVTPPAQDSLATRADLARIEGSPDAKLWMVVVSDFQCPYCKQWNDQTAPAIRDEYVKTGKIRIAYVNFPLNIHPNAWPAAMAAMCAGAQGKFWPMHDALFANQERWAELPNAAPVLDSLATAVGVNKPAWQACLSSKDVRALIQADDERAQQAGVHSTPSFLIGNKMIEGAAPVEEFRKTIDAALVKTTH